MSLVRGFGRGFPWKEQFGAGMGRVGLGFWTALWVLVSMWTGCSGSGDDGTCKRSEDQPSVDGGLQCGQPFQLNQVDGQGQVVGPGLFGIKVVEYVHVNAGGIVETDTITVLLMLASFHQQEGSRDLDVAIQFCDIQIPKVDIPGQPAPATFETLPDLMPNVPSARIKATLSGDKTCDSFVMERAIGIIGGCLADSLEDPLPDDPVGGVCPGTFDISQKDTFCDGKAGCMYDVDLDGYPGSTLVAHNIPGLDVDLVFAVMRSWVQLEGMVATSDLLLGTAHFDLLVAPFGCRLTPMGGGDQRDCTADELQIVAKINPDITQTPGQDSTFVAVRVSQDTDCQYIIDHELEVFGR